MFCNYKSIWNSEPISKERIKINIKKNLNSGEKKEIVSNISVIKINKDNNWYHLIDWLIVYCATYNHKTSKWTNNYFKNIDKCKGSQTTQN